MNTYYVPNNFHNITNSSDLLHDYLYFTIKDILISKNIPVITKNDICTNIILSRLFQGETPDIFTVSNRKLYCFDIFSKYNQYSIYDQEDIISWRNKYEKVKLFCDFEIIDVVGFKRIACFKNLFTDDELDFITQNYNIFKKEYKNGDIISTNNNSITFSIPSDYQNKVNKLLAHLNIIHDALWYSTF